MRHLDFIRRECGAEGVTGTADQLYGHPNEMERLEWAETIISDASPRYSPTHICHEPQYQPGDVVQYGGAEWVVARYFCDPDLGACGHSYEIRRDGVRIDVPRECVENDNCGCGTEYPWRSHTWWKV